MAVFNSAAARNYLVSCQSSCDEWLHVKSPNFPPPNLGSASRRLTRSAVGRRYRADSPEVICWDKTELCAEPGQALTKQLAPLTSSSLRQRHNSSWKRGRCLAACTFHLLPRLPHRPLITFTPCLFHYLLMPLL